MEFKYKQDEDGYNIRCNCCGSEAPTSTFKSSRHNEDRELCNFCASSFVANMDEYPEQYDRSVATLGKSLAMMLNIMVDTITERKPPEENSENNS